MAAVFHSQYINANCSNTVKDADFKFDKHVHGESTDVTSRKIFEKGRGQGHVNPHGCKFTWRIYALSERLLVLLLSVYGQRVFCVCVFTILPRLPVLSRGYAHQWRHGSAVFNKYCTTMHWLACHLRKTGTFTWTRRWVSQCCKHLTSSSLVKAAVSWSQIAVAVLRY